MYYKDVKVSSRGLFGGKYPPLEELRPRKPELGQPASRLRNEPLQLPVKWGSLTVVAFYVSILFNTTVLFRSEYVGVIIIETFETRTGKQPILHGAQF
jgi:hypothetical protein